jgi:Family of unknown function (DUF5330)
MFFLLRMAFWLSLVLILLPTGSAQHSSPANEVGASDAISAASATVGDLKGFCARQPGACTVGSQVASALGSRAQAGAKMLYDFLTEKMASRETGPATSGNAAKSAANKAAVEKASQNTLTPADLTPAWRGPIAHKDAKRSA